MNNELGDRTSQATGVTALPDFDDDHDTSVRFHAKRFHSKGKLSHGVSHWWRKKGKFQTRELAVDVDDGEEHVVLSQLRFEWQRSVAKFIMSSTFEFGAILCIILNTLVMVFEDQYRGLERGYKMHFPTVTVPAEDSWPEAAEVFSALEWAFGIVFALEFLTKVLVFERRVFADKWNWLDFIIVLGWVVDRASTMALFISPTLLRLARLFRVLRVVKLTRSFRSFDRFYLMTSALKASTSAAFYGFLLLLMIQVVVGLLIQSALYDFLVDGNQPLEVRHLVYKHFGTFSRSLFTLFELTLANWSDPVRVLTENVAEWWGACLLVYVLCVSFAVVRVIMSVFTSVTFFVYEFDDELLIQRQQRKSEMHLKKMTSLFKAADVDGNGFLDLEEFRKIFAEPQVKGWLGAMDFGYSLYGNTADALFALLDDGDGVLTAKELVEGVAKNKGAAKSVGLAVVMVECKQITDLVSTIMTVLKGRRRSERRRSSVKRLSAMPGAVGEVMEEVLTSSSEDSSEPSPRTKRSARKPWMRSMTQQAFDSQGGLAARLFISGSRASMASMDSSAGVWTKAHIYHANFRAIVHSVHFEVFFVVVQMIYALISLLEAQYDGMQVGFDIGYPSCSKPASEEWFGLDRAIEIAHVVLGTIFVLELLLKCFADGIRIFRNIWNILDVVACCSWLLELTPFVSMPMKVSLLRLVRVTRFSRLLVMVRLRARFSKLQLMWAAIRGSCAALCWTVFVLLFGLIVVALTLGTLVDDAYQDEHGADITQRWQLYLYFGSFSKIMLTLFEMTLANWIPPSRNLVETAGEWYMLYALFHKLSYGFCIVTVIAAVFLQETFTIAKNDNAVQHNMRSAAAREHTKKMTRLFKIADKDGSGSVDLEEFRVIMRAPGVAMWMSAMGLDMQDVDAIFQMIDDGDGCLTAQELMDGLAHMKGVAKDIDLNMINLELRKLSAKVQELQNKCRELDLESLLPTGSQSSPMRPKSTGGRQFRATDSLQRNESESCRLPAP